ncbi:phage major capsid protein [Sphingomonadaceae bacterium G21617-S1]|nr:phage major capsid protein [Sphingomonadaceae bacterium G21617-S1]
MPTLTELQEKRGGLVTQARSALEEIKNNTDDARRTELEQRHDTIMGELDALDATIAREERVATAERSLEERRERDARNGRPPQQPITGEPGGGENGEVTYRGAFHAYLRAQGQMGELTSEQRSALRQGYQALSPEQRAQTTSNAAGGYTVPTELQAELIKTMKMWGPMYDPGVTRELVTSSGNPIPWPTVDDTANTGAATTQGTTLTDDGSGDVVFAQKQLDAYAFATPWLRVSKELADDSIFNVESTLGDLLGERLGRLANSQCTVGAGGGAPNGVVTASTAGKTAVSTTAFTSDEIIELEHSVDPAYRGSPKAAFMFHDLVLAAIRKLKDGQGNYLWTAGNIQQGVPAQINGRRYHINQAMSSTFTTGQKLILWGDFSKYIVRKVGAPLIGAIQDKDFWPGFGIAGWIRFDGELMDTAAIKHLKLA